ncbi:hypothetical protein CRG98_011734 [Punica granatum]|uniref:Reverse transcriptase domain-containing protein n=1 Tax=Punica granatum TaxID=22663 RepID=A0A2I0KJB2_PUNGR|nr:hypothetical protein CRG98_011734 [Punica granatum]
MAGKQVDLRIKLWRIDGPTKKGEGESSRKTTTAATPTSGRRGKEVSVNAVNLGHQGFQQYSMSFTPAPACHSCMRFAARALSASTPNAASLLFGPTGSTSTTLGFESSSAGAVGLSPAGSTRRHDTITAASTVHAPAGPTLPYTGNSSLRYEYHSGALGHTINNCWKLWEEVRKMINANQLSFNAVRPPNVQANPLPYYGSSSGPTINMIGICALREDESKQEGHVLFVIEYVPVEIAVGFTGSDDAPTPFVIEVPAREPYQDNKGPWTYEESIGSLEQQFSVMGVTCSGRVYENPDAARKEKAPTAAFGTVSESTPTPPKKITEEEAEVFMKIIKASEYKVVEQMGKSPAHISLLALLLGSKPHREVLLKIDPLIDVGPCSFAITFQVLDIPNAFSLLLGRPWIHSVGAVPSSLHQRLKFIAEDRLITVKGEEDYAIYKETVVPYICIGEVENLPFHSFETISVIWDYEEVGPSRADRMVGKVLLRKDRGLAAPLRSKSTRTGGDSVFTFLGTRLSRPTGASTSTVLPRTMGGSTRASWFPCSPTLSPNRRTLSEENEGLDNPHYSTVIADVLHLNPNLRHGDSNPSNKRLDEPRSIYFGEKLDEDGRVPEIEESLRRLEDRQLTSVEPTEEVHVRTEEEPRTLKIGTGLDPTQRARMIDFLTEYQEHFLPLDTERFPSKRQHLRRQCSGLLLRIKEEVVKQINAGFLEVCNYSEWVANIIPVEKKDGRVRVCVEYRDLNKTSPKDNFPLPHIDVLVDNTARHTQFSFMDGFSEYNQIQMAKEDKIKTTFITMWGTFCYRVMPFGLKNTGATYQMAMITFFHDMMHKEIEVYVDDTIAKSKEGEDHLVNLKRLFVRLKEYKLRRSAQSAPRWGNC